MSKGLKLVLSVLAVFFCITLLHVWLNIGFKNLGIGGSAQNESSMRVGFLPVT
jgi:hypothetical protein